MLSQLLGLGKGGLKMAPEEALGELLQVCTLKFLTNPSVIWSDIFLVLLISKHRDSLTFKYIDGKIRLVTFVN